MRLAPASLTARLRLASSPAQPPLWDVAALARPPRSRLLGSRDGIAEVLFEGEPYRGRTTEVFAYLGLPEGVPAAPGGPVPGMVCLHAGAGRAYREWVERWTARGFAAIAPDLSARGPGGERLARGGPEQVPEATFDLTQPPRDLWTYHAVAAALSAASLLAAWPGVDPRRIGVMGISWGGALACLAAGLDRRFACAVPVFGCGFLQHPSGRERRQVFAGLSAADRRRWHELFDPATVLPACRLPMLFVSGATEGGFPLDVLKASYSRVAGPVYLSVRAELDHDHEAVWNAPEPYRFGDQVLRGGAPLPRLGPIERRGGELRAELVTGASVENGTLAVARAGESQRGAADASIDQAAPEAASRPAGGRRRIPVGEPVTSAVLLATADRGEWKHRRWSAHPARLETGRVSAPAPAEATAFFFAVEDALGAVVSSPYEEGDLRPRLARSPGRRDPRHAASRPARRGRPSGCVGPGTAAREGRPLPAPEPLVGPSRSGRLVRSRRGARARPLAEAGGPAPTPPRASASDRAGRRAGPARGRRPRPPRRAAR